MAALLDALYVVVTVIIAGGGLVLTLQGVAGTDRQDSRWLELTAVGVALLFILGLGGQFLM